MNVVAAIFIKAKNENNPNSQCSLPDERLNEM